MTLNDNVYILVGWLNLDDFQELYFLKLDGLQELYFSNFDDFTNSTF